MTDFEKKRLKYLIKAARNSEYIQLGTGDIEWLTELLDSHEEASALEEVLDKIKQL